jgi:hypothetical protein
MFFDFLLDQTLYAVEVVVVTTKAGTWTLDDTILFVLEGDRRIQVLIDIDTQVKQLVESDKITIRGDYDDLLSYDVIKHHVGVALPSKVQSVTEFQAPNGKVVSLEVELESAGFALILDPEDVEVRDFGSGWQYCRDFGVPQIGQVIVTLARSQYPFLR